MEGRKLTNQKKGAHAPKRNSHNQWAKQGVKVLLLAILLLTTNLFAQTHEGTPGLAFERIGATRRPSGF